MSAFKLQYRKDKVWTMPTREQLLALGILPSEVGFYQLVAAGQAPRNPQPFNPRLYPQFLPFLNQNKT